MAATATDPREYAKNHWGKHEADSEHAARVESAEQSAAWYFEQATKPQKAAYTLAMSDLRGLSGPRYDRAREAAKAAWERSTREASELFYRTCDALMAAGEVSEALSAEWDALAAKTEAKAALEANIGAKIITNYDYPPIPDRRFDWSAVTDNYDGEGSPIGHGPTEEIAIVDLIDQIEERA